MTMKVDRMSYVAAKRVVGPDGRVWHVRREWMKRPRRRWRRRKRERERDFGAPAEDVWAGADAVGTVGEFAELIPPIAIAIGIIGLALVAWFVVLPALVLLFDVLFLVVTAAAGVIARVLFKRPWDVVAECEGDLSAPVEIPVVGFRNAGDKVAELAFDIETGREPFAPVTRR
jgi:hypothetical protein